MGKEKAKGRREKVGIEGMEGALLFVVIDMILYDMI